MICIKLFFNSKGGIHFLGAQPRSKRAVAPSSPPPPHTALVVLRKTYLINTLAAGIYHVNTLLQAHSKQTIVNGGNTPLPSCGHKAEATNLQNMAFLLVCVVVVG